MTILVTGAAGFIGSHLCDRLLDLGEDVVGLDSFDDFYPRARKERNLDRARDHHGFTLLEDDIRDSDALSRISSSVDTVIHLAARAGVRPSVEDPVLYADVNVTGTANLLAWADRREVAAFIFGSSSSVYGNNAKVSFSEIDRVDTPISPYAATKRSAELLCHAASAIGDMTIPCLRLFTVYGPRQRPDLAIHKFARALREGGEIPMFGDGSTARDYTYIDDVVSGVLGALDWARGDAQGFELFNLGSNRTISLREMIDVIASEMGVEPVIKPLPPQPGDMALTYADTAKAKLHLGYDASTDFRSGVQSFLEWFEDMECATAEGTSRSQFENGATWRWPSTCASPCVNTRPTPLRLARTPRSPSWLATTSPVSSTTSSSCTTATVCTEPCSSGPVRSVRSITHSSSTPIASSFRTQTCFGPTRTRLQSS